MLARDLKEELGGYTIRSFKENNKINTASLYKGKNKVGDIIYGNNVLDVKMKNDKEEMAYNAAIRENKLDGDFVCLLLDRAELVLFEEGLKEYCKTMTVYSIKGNDKEVFRLNMRYEDGGKEWLSENHGSDIDICYNTQL